MNLNISVSEAKNVRELKKQIQALQKENEILKECVEFYAEFENWSIEKEWDTGSRIFIDNQIADEPQGDSQKGTWVGGKRARECKATIDRLLGGEK